MDETKDPLADAPRWLPDGRQPYDQEMEASFALLALAAIPVPPPAGVRQRLLSAVRERHERRGPGALDARQEVRPGVSLVRTRFLPWEEHPSPGVRIKNVSTDPITGSPCLLVELAPGSVFPDHDHAGVEKVFIVRGSVSVAGRLLQTGDFCRSDPGTSDWDITTDEGALLLVISDRAPLSHADAGNR
ncbi:MAG: cupin domain-containing protein [Acidobacteriota bacterium]|nr:cupin domain-containing protein [Acidobacteriota bacterium]